MFDDNFWTDGWDELRDGLHARLARGGRVPGPEEVTAQARTGSQTGERLWLIHDVD